jgi:hypothetical protein
LGEPANASVTGPVSVVTTSELGVTWEIVPRTIGVALGADTSPAAAAESDRALDFMQATPHKDAARSATADRVKRGLASTTAPSF